MATEAKSLLRRANVLIVDDRPAQPARRGGRPGKGLRHRARRLRRGSDQASEGPDGHRRHPDGRADARHGRLRRPAATIKKMPGCDDIPIVFVTAVYKEDPHVKKGYESGGIDYFGKPFAPGHPADEDRGLYSDRLKSHLLQQRERPHPRIRGADPRGPKALGGAREPAGRRDDRRRRRTHLPDHRGSLPHPAIGGAGRE